jgi:hypothetical protein
MDSLRVNETEREPNGKTKRSIEILTDSDGRHNIPTFPDCKYIGSSSREASKCFTPPEFAEIFGLNPEMCERTFAEPLETTGIPYKKVQSSCPKDGLTVGLTTATTDVLRRMKAIATAHFGQEVKHAVVAIPADLNDEQRVSVLREWKHP